MTPRALEEYRALRATIATRGTARMVLFAVGLALWAALVLATAAIMTVPLATLLPLLVLAGLFEAVLALHLGVERVGRYLQVFFETADAPDAPRWEHVAMQFGAAAAKGTPSPIFASTFLLATLANFIPASLAGALPIEYVIIGGVHLLFVVRVLAARRLVAGQRARDLARFEELKGGDRR